MSGWKNSWAIPRDFAYNVYLFADVSSGYAGQEIERGVFWPLVRPCVIFEWFVDCMTVRSGDLGRATGKEVQKWGSARFKLR